MGFWGACAVWLLKYLSTSVRWILRPLTVAMTPSVALLVLQPVTDNSRKSAAAGNKAIAARLPRLGFDFKPCSLLLGKTLLGKTTLKLAENVPRTPSH